jgi:hypothetical protein
MPRSKVGDHFQSLFEYAPISLWEEDYSAIKLFFDNLRADGVVDLHLYLDEHPEEIENSIHRRKIKRFNRETLCMFGADSEEECLPISTGSSGMKCGRTFGLNLSRYGTER